MNEFVITDLTLYYSKRTGEIKKYCTGIQDMRFFGEDKEEMSIIWDFVVVPYDKNITDDIKKFKVNLERKTIEMKPEAIPEYPIAAQ